jgi:predicted secreted protein
MAIYTGRNGLVKLALATTEGGTPGTDPSAVTGLGTLRSWTIDHKANLIDITTMVSSGLVYSKVMPGIRSWSASFSMLWDDADTTLSSANLVPGRYVHVWIYPHGSSDVYNGVAAIETVHANANHDGLVEMSLTITGHDALTTTFA